MEKRFAFLFFRTNCLKTYSWNGTGPTPNYSQILKGIQQKIVRFSSLLIYNLDTRDDFDEINYSFMFNLPSFREFSNVYNEKFMTLF
jgi:hypothetical protein